MELMTSRNIENVFVLKNGFTNKLCKMRKPYPIPIIVQTFTRIGEIFFELPLINLFEKLTKANLSYKHDIRNDVMIIT